MSSRGARRRARACAPRSRGVPGDGRPPEGMVGTLNSQPEEEGALSATQSWRAQRRLVCAPVESILVNPGRHVQVTLPVPTVDGDGPPSVLPEKPHSSRVLGFSTRTDSTRRGDRTRIVVVFRLAPDASSLRCRSSRSRRELYGVLARPRAGARGAGRARSCAISSRSSLTRSPLGE